MPTARSGLGDDLVAQLTVPGGIKARWYADVPLGASDVTFASDGTHLTVTWKAGKRGFRDVYVVEKTGTKEGWSHPAADEEWQQGFYGEVQDFVECCVRGTRPQSDAVVAHDTVATLYAGYLSAERGGQQTPVPVAPLEILQWNTARSASSRRTPPACRARGI